MPVRSAPPRLVHGPVAEVPRSMRYPIRSASVDAAQVRSTPVAFATPVGAAGAVGARMVGGGFGGSVLGLFPPGAGLPAGAVAVVPGPPARLV